MADRDVPTSRVGYINVQGDYSELIPATLDERSGGGVTLRVPYLDGNFPERWFWNDFGVRIGTDGDELLSEKPPSELDYFDNKGPVGLVGCRTDGHNSLLFGAHSASAGVGGLTANFAVEKAERAAHYAEINGFRSEIDGLGYWLDLWAHRTVMTLPKQGTPTSVTTTMQVPPDLRLASKLNLRATVRGTSPGSQKPEIRYTSTALLQTYSTSKREWMEHLVVHRAIRDLVRVAVWKPIAFIGHEAMSDAERIVIKKGDLPAARWCEVKTAVTGVGDAIWGKAERPLFVFADLKVSGIQRWLSFSVANRRGLSPFMRLLDIRQGTVDELIAQLGIAIEALGYQAFLDAGASEIKASSKTMAQRVRKIATEVEGCVPGASATFAQDFADGYNGVKHANRPEAVPADLIDLYRLGVTIVRAWIALRLGVPENVVTERLR